MRLLCKEGCIPVMILLFALLCFCPLGTAHAEAVSIDVRESVMDIRAKKTTLADVLKALSAKTGLSLSLGKPLTDAFSCDLKEVTLEDAVERLMANHNYALTYRKTGDGRFLPDTLIVLGAGAPQQSVARIAGDKTNVSQDEPHPDVRMKMDWFRQQFKDVDALSGQFAATFFFDKSRAGNILITGMSEKSPLRQIGLREGDVIQNVNGKKISSIQEFLQHLVSVSDDTRLVRIQRGSKAYPLFIYLE